MEIMKTVVGGEMTIAVEGRLDAVTSVPFDAEVAGVPAEIRSIVFDFAKLDFISSAGLRVIVGAYKTMKERAGCIKVLNANTTVLNVLKLTGLSAVLGMG